jgi:hypothetical protein
LVWTAPLVAAALSSLAINGGADVWLLAWAFGQRAPAPLEQPSTASDRPAMAEKMTKRWDTISPRCFCARLRMAASAVDSTDLHRNAELTTFSSSITLDALAGYPIA